MKVIIGFGQRLAGLREVEKNLNAAIAKIEKQSFAGAVKGAELVRAESQKLCPVVTGTLMNSAEVVPEPPLVVHIRYKAIYAVAVHENSRAGKTGGKSPSGRIYKPGTFSTVGQWRFLETALKMNSDRVLEFIASEAQV